MPGIPKLGHLDPQEETASHQGYPQAPDVPVLRGGAEVADKPRGSPTSEPGDLQGLDNGAGTTLDIGICVASSEGDIGGKGTGSGANQKQGWVLRKSGICRWGLARPVYWMIR